MAVIVEGHLASHGTTCTVAWGLDKAAVILVMVASQLFQAPKVVNILRHALVRRPVPTVVGIMLRAWRTRVGEIMGIRVCRQLSK